MRRVNRILELIPMVGLVLIVSTVLLQIFLRYILLYPLSWSDELARITHIWLVFMGAYIAFTKNLHVKFEYFMSFLPKKWDMVLEVFINVLCGFFVFFLLYSASMAVVKLFKARTAAMGLPMPFVFSATLISSILMLTHFALTVIKGVRYLFSNDSTEPMRSPA